MIKKTLLSPQTICRTRLTGFVLIDRLFLSFLVVPDAPTCPRSPAARTSLDRLALFFSI